MAVINQNVSTVMKIDGKPVRTICGYETLQSTPLQEASFQAMVEVLSGEPNEQLKPSEKCVETIERLFVQEVAAIH